MPTVEATALADGRGDAGQGVAAKTTRHGLVARFCVDLEVAVVHAAPGA